MFKSLSTSLIARGILAAVPRDPSLAATEEARRRPRRCASVPYQV